jgi:3-oxoacyl-[acyl-carrier protein] reductase
MTGPCEGKVAVVTGDRGHLADAIAGRLAAAGATLADSVPEDGKVDILVFAAGYPDTGPLHAVVEEDFKALIQAQLWAPYAATQQVLPGMRSRGAGWILHVGDPRGAHPTGAAAGAGGTAHGPSSVVMAALSRLSTGMAAELLTDGVAVNWLSPAEVDPEAEELAALADVAVLLCSEPAARCTARVVVGSAAFERPETPVLRT